MKNKIYFLFSLLLILIFPLVISEEQSLKPIKLNECILLRQECSNCSWVNISTITYPNSTIADQQIAMSKSGITFSYNFCNTTQLGSYIVSGWSDADNNPPFSYDFIVNGSGQEVSQSQITLIIIGIVVLLIVCSFFFILGILFKHPGTKIFLMALSATTLIAVIGIIASNAAVYLAEFPSLVSMYNTYYIIIISLAGAAMIGIILWLIYYSVKLFNSSRGRNPDDD